MADLPGTNGDDFLVGTEEDDTIRGFAGNDFILGVGGNDTLDGGDDSGDSFGFAQSTHRLPNA
jgi:Ca2+-binding RTX toxin-like protein